MCWRKKFIYQHGQNYRAQFVPYLLVAWFILITLRDCPFSLIQCIYVFKDTCRFVFQYAWSNLILNIFYFSNFSQKICRTGVFQLQVKSILPMFCHRTVMFSENLTLAARPVSCKPRRIQEAQIFMLTKVRNA